MFSSPQSWLGLILQLFQLPSYLNDWMLHSYFWTKSRYIHMVGRVLHSSAQKCWGCRWGLAAFIVNKKLLNLGSPFMREGPPLPTVYCSLIQTGYARYWRTGGRWRFFISVWSLWSWISTTDVSLISSKRKSLRKPFMISQAGLTLRMMLVTCQRVHFDASFFQQGWDFLWSLSVSSPFFM